MYLLALVLGMGVMTMPGVGQSISIAARR